MTTQYIKRAFGLMALLIITLTLAALLSSFERRAPIDGVWEKLGLSDKDGKDKIIGSFMDGYLHCYGVKNPGKILLSDRAAITRDLLSVTKEELSSKAFNDYYQKQRLASQPHASEQKERTKDEIRQERITETEKALNQTKENIKKMDPKIAEQLKGAIDVLEQQLKDFRDPNSELIEMMYQGEKMSHEQQKKSYEESVDKWKQDFPEKTADFIAARLNKFLTLAASVDFSATTHEVNGKKKFDKPAYEAKPYDWKQVYRAGKEVIEPATAFARQWLKELK